MLAYDGRRKQHMREAREFRLRHLQRRVEAGETRGGLRENAKVVGDGVLPDDANRLLSYRLNSAQDFAQWRLHIICWQPREVALDERLLHPVQPREIHALAPVESNRGFEENEIPE